MVMHKRVVGSILAIMGVVATMHAASAAIIDSTVPFVTSTGSTHTDIVDGANVSFFDAYQSSTVTMSGGEVSFLTLHDAASADISGGAIGFLQVYDNSFATLTGVDTLSWLIVDTNAFVEIHAANVLFSSGILSGNWGDGTAFEFWAVNGSSGQPISIPESLPSNISIVPLRVPEPATLSLLALGLAGVVFGRSRRKLAQGG